MLIRQIELENFLTHEREQVNLPEQGIFFLDAPSGGGKSSFIVDSVLYALFGPAGARGDKHEDLMHLDHPDEPMVVKVTFELERGELLSVERTLTAAGSRFSPNARVLDQDGEPLAEGAQATTRYVKKRLGGMNWQQMKAAFVCHQEEIIALTAQQPAKRKELVHRLLGIRELELAQENLGKRRLAAKTALEQVQARVGERTKESEEARVAAFKVQAKALAKERAEVEAALASSEKEASGLEERLAPLKSAAEAKSTIASLEASMRHRAEALKESKAKLASQQEAEARLSKEGPETEAALKEAELELERLRQAGERANSHAKLLERRAEAQERAQAAREALAALGEATQTPEALEARLGVVKSEQARLEEELEAHGHDLHVLDEQGVCFTCQRPLGEGEERERILQAVEAARSSRQERLLALASEEKELAGALPKAREAATSRRGAEKGLIEAEANLAQLAQEIAALEEDGVAAVDDLRAAYAAKRQEISRLEGLRGQLQAVKEALDRELGARVIRLETEQQTDEQALAEAKRLAKVEVDLAEIERLEKELAAQLASAAECRGKLFGLSGQEKQANQQLEEAKRDLERFRDLLEKREGHYQDVVRLETLGDYLDQFVVALAAEIRPELEGIATEMIYQMSGGRFVAMEIDEDYNIRVQREEGNWEKVSSLSGGEKTRANLCLRLALTRLVSQRTGVPVQFIVLDEPFGNLDPALIDVSMGLLDSLRSFYPQIFLISHTGDLGSSQHVDYRLAFEGDGEGRARLYQR